MGEFCKGETGLLWRRMASPPESCQVLVSFLDRKAKLLGMDCTRQSGAPAGRAPETEERRARAREALRVWTRFAVDPKDFQGNDLD